MHIFSFSFLVIFSYSRYIVKSLGDLDNKMLDNDSGSSYCMDIYLIVSFSMYLGTGKK